MKVFSRAKLFPHNKMIHWFYERERFFSQRHFQLTLFVSPVKMMPLASRRISPGWSCPVAQAAWCGNKRLIRTRPGYGALESTPPDTDNPSPRGPLIISTLNVQSGMISKKGTYWILFVENSVCVCVKVAAGNWKTFWCFFSAHIEDKIKWVEKIALPSSMLKKGGTCRGAVKSNLEGRRQGPFNECHEPMKWMLCTSQLQPWIKSFFMSKFFLQTMMVFSFIQVRLAWEDFEKKKIFLNTKYRERKRLKIKYSLGLKGFYATAAD